jgi:uncharacterized LabA/DUF88 family protein
MKRVIILIDGQNLFYGLRNIGILEKEINWKKFFNSLLSADDELIRTYWFCPQKIQDAYFTNQNIKNHIVFKNFNSYCSSYKSDPKSLPAHIETQIDTEVNKVESWLKQEKTRFSQIEYNYDQLSLEYEDIEIVKTGIIKINPYLQEYIGEKGVDIALAVKMIALSVENKCDKIILLSGDYDYAEAIKFVKNNMTKIHIVKIHKGYPPKNRSVSRDLAVLADKILDVYESEIRANYLK